MSQKFYVVSEEELRALVEANSEHFYQLEAGTTEQSKISAEYVEKAKEVCRSRPVPEWATHFSDGTLDCVEIKW